MTLESDLLNLINGNGQTSNQTLSTNQPGPNNQMGTISNQPGPSKPSTTTPPDQQCLGNDGNSAQFLSNPYDNGNGIPGVGQSQLQVNGSGLPSNNVVGEIRIPPYWHREGSPRGWFLQLETVFTMRCVRNDKTKYHHLIACLPQDVVHTVLDIIERPPSENLYETLKNAIIERNSESEERRLEKLLSLSNTEFCDRKPSDYYRFLANLAGSKFDTRLLVKLWMRRLPQSIGTVLVATGYDNPVNLLPIADRMWDSIPSLSVSSVTGQVPRQSLMVQQSINAVQSTSTQSNDLCGIVQLFQEMSSRMQSMEARIEARIESIQRGHEPNSHRGRHFSRNRSSSRARSTSSRRRDTDPVDTSICWYHRRFKERATKCNRPCSFRSASNNSNQL